MNEHFESMTLLLELKQISKKYCYPSEIEILKNISLQLSPGVIISIIGESGTGKSTILHIAGGLDSASSGEVCILGKPISKLSEDKKSFIRLSSIGFIYQYHFLLPDFNILENVMLPIRIAKKDYTAGKILAEKLLDKLGLSNRIKHYPDQLSGGEQQRVAIARAMINSPQIILADEPTGSLDPNNSQIVFEMLKTEVKLNNCGAIIVTHSNEIARQADVVYEIKGGILERI